MPSYQLLPCFFERLPNDRVLLVSQGGSFCVVSTPIFEAFSSRTLALDHPFFLELKSKQLLYDEDLETPKRILATQYRTRKGFLLDFTMLHMMVLTVRCNMKCNYCHATSEIENGDRKRYDMPPEVIRKTVDCILSAPSPFLKIEFQGGEPLLRFDLIKETVAYANERAASLRKNLEFVVCTNLTILEDEHLEFFRCNKIHVSTSYDGPKTLHDLHRIFEGGRGTHDRFVQNLKKTIDTLGPEYVNALMTTTRDSLGRITEIVDAYVSLGLSSFFFRSLNPYGRAMEFQDKFEYSAEEFVRAYRKGLEHIIQLNLLGKPLIEGFATLLLSRMLTPFPTGFVDLQSPSGAGIGGAIYDYNGDVYLADEGRMLARKGNFRFRLGNVMTNTHREMFGSPLIREIAEKSVVESMPGCSNCAYHLWCGADPVRNYALQGDCVGHRPTSEFCTKQKGLFSYLLEKILENDEKVLEVFWSWILRRPVSHLRIPKPQWETIQKGSS
ncbi:MAG: His-Xaa-Ser system radical SAM maturase HxsB [Verrucomicrobiae bacterium]|nr:His-Xaa-Ser system radical SAM maturase HxsB [Verrucomicrobiae bacterium]